MIQKGMLVTKKLYVGLVSGSEIFRTEIEWALELVVIEDIRRLIKLELPLEWQGSLIVDDKPILSTDSQDCMLWADVKRSNNGGVDLNVRQLLWRGGTPNSNRPLG
jgi:hypothetical protein